MLRHCCGLFRCIICLKNKRILLGGLGGSLFPNTKSRKDQVQQVFIGGAASDGANFRGGVAEVLREEFREGDIRGRVGDEHEGIVEVIQSVSNGIAVTLAGEVRCGLATAEEGFGVVRQGIGKGGAGGGIGEIEREDRPVVVLGRWGDGGFIGLADDEQAALGGHGGGDGVV